MGERRVIAELFLDIAAPRKKLRFLANVP